jgi:uncharacterized damage-inducible protein DinB
MSEVFAVGFRHNVWANQRILETAEGVSDSVLDSAATGTFGSLRDTLVHLFAAEERYVASMTGNTRRAPPLAEGAFPGFDVLKQRARASGEALISMAREVEDDRTIRGEHPVRGKFAIPVSIFFAQAINHATEHRGQINTILTQSKIEPPDLDVWMYHQHVAGGAD